jgi:hypothetical protein
LRGSGGPETLILCGSTMEFGEKVVPRKYDYEFILC